MVRLYHRCLCLDVKTANRTEDADRRSSEDPRGSLPCQKIHSRAYRSHAVASSLGLQHDFYTLWLGRVLRMLNSAIASTSFQLVGINGLGDRGRPRRRSVPCREGPALVPTQGLYKDEDPVSILFASVRPSCCLHPLRPWSIWERTARSCH